MNTELRQLAAAGAKVIQIEEPTIHFTACLPPGGDGAARLHGRRVQPRGRGPRRRRAVDPHLLGQPEHAEGLHAASRTRTRSTSTSNRLKGDVWTVEATENELAEIDLFKPYASNLAKKVAVGVVSHRTAAGRHGAGRRRPDPARARGDPGRQADPVERLRLRPAGLQPDGRVLQGDRASRRAATSCSRSSGWRSATSPAADPALQTDVLPDREPLTHLPSPWK